MTIDLSAVELDEDPTLVLGWWRSDSIEARRVDIGAEVAEAFRKSSTNAIESLDAATRRRYSAEASLERDEYFALATSELDGATSWIDNLLSADDLPKLKTSELGRRPLLFYAFAFDAKSGSNRARVVFVRKHNPRQSASTGRTVASLGNVLKKIDEPVFAFDAKTDLIVTADEVLILSVTPFELLFKNEDLIQKRIPRWVDDLSKALPLSSISAKDIAERASTNHRVRRRLEAINERGHLATVELKQVKKYAKSQGLDPDDIVMDGEIDTTTLGTEQVLKLLNEDLVTGALSGAHFEVERKSVR